MENVADLKLDDILKDNDNVVCGQVCAEPLTLTRCLVAAAARSAVPLTVFVGTLFSDTFDAAPANMRFRSYGAIGRASAIADRSALDILPEAYSRLPALFGSGLVRADVVLLQAALDENGVPSFGLASDYVLDAARRARTVIVEINEHVPWTYGTPWPRDLRVDHWVRAKVEPLELPAANEGQVAQAIARHVASIVPDGATVQVGVGSLPDATLNALRSHRHLGLHSGVLGDAGVRLIEEGVIDNSMKGVDAGISVTNTLCGSRASYRFAHKNRSIEVRHSRFTHDAGRLAQLAAFHAINSALEVDLSGQVNCEMVNSRQRGGIGGLPDFGRAARACPGGRSITVLPSTAAGGTVSRIVASLDGRPVTIGRADVDTVVTEHGIADLRGASLEERARRLIAVAAPEHRDALARQHATAGERQSTARDRGDHA